MLPAPLTAYHSPKRKRLSAIVANGNNPRYKAKNKPAHNPM